MTTCDELMKRVEQTRMNLVERNKQAIQYFEDGQGYENGSKEIEFGTDRGQLQKERQAFQYFLAAAMLGHKDAMGIVGIYYSKGKGGVTRDDRKALDWYERGQAAGDSRSARNAALFHAQGRGGKYSDPEYAMRSLQQAANAKNARAKSNLALIYESGKWGRHPDEVLALKYYREAADAGDAGGQCGLAWFYEKNKGGLWEAENLDSVKATDLARHYYRLAADQNHVFAARVADAAAKVAAGQEALNWRSWSCAITSSSLP
eukprot:CAMPEP_0113675298 /NCGR_PEP_ID=MMETSP0038_2-20120614/7932_1 /TAXON_ID=2898 /ORGANISM="Cryptomonas paramecium" /LENGTH=260 /DNA_ID=CAMNT_0000592045 /DNA_START=26 /DNA_END=803 /DNA_ORIENTATION=+ /assembly_acc=CAM_ASM_000170